MKISVRIITTANICDNIRFGVKLDYDGWLKAARDRIEALKSQRVAIDAELAALEQSVSAFETLANSKWTPPDSGLTEAIRNVLASQSGENLSATQIRDAVSRRGLILNQKNPLAAIHQTLARLVQSGEVEPVSTSTGRTVFRLANAEHRSQSAG